MQRYFDKMFYMLLNKDKMLHKRGYTIKQFFKQNYFCNTFFHFICFKIYVYFYSPSNSYHILQM